jgi:hypothetical protein
MRGKSTSAEELFTAEGLCSVKYCRTIHERTAEWIKLHNEKLNDLYSSSNIIRVIKSRIMRWAELVARMGERRDVYRVLVGKP